MYITPIEDTEYFGGVLKAKKIYDLPEQDWKILKGKAYKICSCSLSKKEKESAIKISTR